MTDTEDRMIATQVGLTTSDIVGTTRLFVELGFTNGGGHMIWGSPMAIQGLPPSARGQMQWLVGWQARVQLELFHLTCPAQRPLPLDWRCSDLGWTRIGIAVPNLESAKATLAHWCIPGTGEMALAGEPSRLAYRDPFIGCFVELIEDGDTMAGWPIPRDNEAGAAILYATSSVSDLDAARFYYECLLKQRVTMDNTLHRPEHEALWGLEGASSKSFVVEGGGFLLEIVQYFDPVGRPKRADYTPADQGLMNVAIGAKSREVAEPIIDSVRQQGYRTSDKVSFDDTCAIYVLDPEREVELFSLPESLEAAFGYAPAAPFFGQRFAE